jgi:hypothetical protein
MVGTHVHLEPARLAGEFDDLALVDLGLDRATQLPRRSVIIGIDRVRTIFVRALAHLAVGIVVTVHRGNDEPAGVRAVLDLNADPGAGRIPSPGRIL